MAIKNIVVMTKAQAQSLLTNGSVTINSVTYTTGDTIPCIAADLYYRHNLEVTLLDSNSNSRTMIIAIINTQEDAMTEEQVYNELMTYNVYIAYDADNNQALYFTGQGYFYSAYDAATLQMSDVTAVTNDNVELIV